MSAFMVIVLLVVGAILVGASLLLRVYTQGKHEVKTVDLIFLIIPLLMVALAMGKLKGIDMLGVKADLSQLWADAANTKVQDQVAPATLADVVQISEPARKGGTGELPRLVGRKTEALKFTLSARGYDAGAIMKYFEALSSLRIVAVEEPTGKLFGTFSAPALTSYLRLSDGAAPAQFEQLLNEGDEEARLELAKLPGFIAASDAVTTTTSKRTAMERMEKLAVDVLPVVDEQQKFIGTVDRAKLTAALILDVTRRLEEK